MTTEPRPMPPEPIDPRVRRVELLISNLLRGGVLVSLALIVLGTVVSFVHHPGDLATADRLRELTHPGRPQPHRIGEILAQLAEFRGQAIVTLGLLVLLLTPVARVAVSIAAFVYQRDRAFVVITSVVLAVLVASILLGQTIHG